MSRMEDVINQFLNTFGIEIKRARYGPSWRTLLRGFFRRFNVDCVLDVGANTGGYGEKLRKSVGYKGLIISFEPVSAVYRQLQQRTTRDRNWVSCPVALGAENQKKKIHVTNVSCFCSFLEPSHKTISDYQKQNEIIAEEEVTVQRLDSLFPQLQSRHGFQRPFLKMDTQGYDLEVLCGAKGALPNIVGLQSEVSLLPIYANMPGLAEMYNAISHWGFDLIGMYPISFDKAGRWIEADAVFVNRNQCPSSTERPDSPLQPSCGAPD